MTTFHPARFTASSAAGPVDQLEADAAATPRWSTASAGATTRTTPGELDALGPTWACAATCAGRCSWRIAASRRCTASWPRTR